MNSYSVMTDLAAAEGLASAALFACAQLCNRAAAALDDDAAAQQPTGTARPAL